MKPTLISRHDAPPFGADGTLITGYAAPSRGAESVSLWRVELDPGTSSPLHELDAEEVFLGLAGSADFTIDGRQLTVRAGDCLVVPPHTAFTLTAGADARFQAVACMPTGGRATLLPAGPTFVPPWAQ